jgi:hypothetical protein
MIPGEWVRQTATAPIAEHVPHVDTPGTTGATDSSRPLTRRAFPWEPWPRWATIAFVVALMLGYTLLAMWGASLSDALSHARITTIGAVAPAEETDAEHESWSRSDVPTLSETTPRHHYA